MIRVGIGYDSHRLVKGRCLILGGVEIPHDKGLAGHSDADALLHAIGDAILGALGAGDIGTHFPDNDAAYQGISSLVLLDQIRLVADRKGYIVHQVDSTVITEQPKLKEYIPVMVERIATALNIAGEDVSIKAKTNEGMGFVGRGEGVAVMAVVTIRREVTP
ncbi:MAG: 2-C-methyl-D-erythritol 2,4-cyclodiphosphate synthase [Syntrophus sp. SKADARSKE-3]|nr:2-C-methyl-D-erythritol 2,4-cyclodiphosphate synthase [Syntrophus sp. SKADARSKE-3]